MDRRDFAVEFEREVRRLRLNMLRLPGLIATGSGWEATLLDRMRALEPGATWEDVFPGLRLPEPDPHLVDAIAAFDADPDAWWREHDLSQQIRREFRRLVSFPLEEAAFSDGGFGWSLPEELEYEELEYALHVLRSLPDGAGWTSFREALHCKRQQD